jgi:serine/threonine protein kinase
MKRNSRLLKLSSRPLLSIKWETQFIKVGTLRQELERLPSSKMSPELLDFIEYLLVVDHTKRSTALEALQHPYLDALP